MTGIGNAGLLSECRLESDVPDNRFYLTAIFAIRISKNGGDKAQLRLKLFACQFNVCFYFLGAHQGKMCMAVGVMSNVNACIPQLSYLIPVHGTWKLFFHAFYGHKNSEGQVRLFKQRPGNVVNGLICIIDRDRNCPVRQRFTVFQPINDFIEWQNGIFAVFQFLNMFLELINTDIGGGVLVFPKPVIHDHTRPVGCPRRAVPCQ